MAEWSENMSYKIAVASSDGIAIDGHFGSASQFYILQVNDDESYQIVENRRLTDVIKNINLPDTDALVKQDQDSVKNTNSCNSSPNCSQDSCGMGCSSSQGGGCGGHSDARINAKIEVIADCRCLLCLKCGPGAERQLERKAITVFQIDIPIADALNKIIPYYSKLDNHVSLRKV